MDVPSVFHKNKDSMLFYHIFFLFYKISINKNTGTEEFVSHGTADRRRRGNAQDDNTLVI